MATASVVPETSRLSGHDALETMRRSGWAELAKGSVQRFRDADGFSHARALGFQLTLTAVPGLIAVVGLTTSLHRAGLRRILERTLLGLAPGPSRAMLAQAFRQGSQAGGRGALIVGLCATLVAGTIAMALIERGANRIYGLHEDRDPANRYVTALLLMFSAGILIAAAFISLIAGPSIAEAGREAGWNNALTTAWTIARWPAGVLLVVVAFSLLYKMAPKRLQPGPAWLSAGAGVAAVLWVAFTVLLAVYLSLSRGFGSTYGPLAGEIGMLLWAYLSSLALYVGVAFAAQLEAVRAGTEPAS